MVHPLEAVTSPEQRGKALLWLLGVSAVLFAVLWSTGADLKTDKAEHGIVSFQLAGDPLASQAILNSWTLKGTTAQTVLTLDYAFLLVYSTALALACVWASKLWSNRAMAGLGSWLAWGQWLAGAFNAVQDYALLRILSTPPTPTPIGLGVLPSAPAQFATETARFCALAKFGLIECGLLYVAASGVNYGLGERLRFQLGKGQS